MPRPFHFPMQRILDFRRQEEEQAQLALARAENELQRIRSSADQLQSELSTAFQHAASASHLDSNQFWLWNRYQARLQLDLESLRSEWHELDQKVNTCRQELIVKAKERKKLERLRDNQMAKHDFEELNKEQKDIDEMATLRFQNRSG